MEAAVQGSWQALKWRRQTPCRRLRVGEENKKSGWVDTDTDTDGDIPAKEGRSHIPEMGSSGPPAATALSCLAARLAS